MNDVKLAEMMKNMPEDMIAESAEFAPEPAKAASLDTNLHESYQPVSAAKSGVRNNSAKKFRFRPVLIAAEIILVAAGALAIIAGVIINRNNSKKIHQDGVDPIIGQTTSLPGEPEKVDLIDVSLMLGENDLGAGQLQIPGEDEELKKSDELFSALLNAQEAGNTGPIIFDGAALVDESWLCMIGDPEQEPRLKNMIRELTPIELEGNARLFRSRIRMDHDLILVDGTIYYTLDRPDLAVDSAVMYDYDGNGVEDILFIFTEKENTQFYGDPIPAASRYWKGFYVLDMTSKEYIKICEYNAPLADMPLILSAGGDAYIWLRSSGMGGKIRREGSGFTVGGAGPDAFFDALYKTSTCEIPLNEITLVFGLNKRTGSVNMKNDHPFYTVNYASESAELSGGWYREKVREQIEVFPVFLIGASDVMQLDFDWIGMPPEVDVCIIDLDAVMRQSYERDESRVSRIYPEENHSFTIYADKTSVVMLTTHYRAPNGSGYEDCFVFILADKNDLPLATLEPTATPPRPLTTETPAVTGPTPTPGPTAIPWEDPESAFNIADRNRFLTAYQGFSYGGLEAPYKYYIFNGSEMEEMPLSGFYQSIMATMKNIAYKRKNKESSFVGISVGKEFTLEPVSGGEIISVDVYAVNDSENRNDIAPELIAEGLSYDEFMEFAASSMDFRTALNGETLPCFAVFTVKKTCQFISVTGEYEYAVKQCVITFIP